MPYMVTFTFTINIINIYQYTPVMLASIYHTYGSVMGTVTMFAVYLEGLRGHFENPAEEVLQFRFSPQTSPQCGAPKR